MYEVFLKLERRSNILQDETVQEDTRDIFENEGLTCLIIVLALDSLWHPR